MASDGTDTAAASSERTRTNRGHREGTRLDDHDCGLEFSLPVRLDTIPNELLAHILQYLPDDSTISSVRATCWRLHDFVGDPKAWNKKRLVLRGDLNWIVMSRVLLRVTSTPLTVLDVAGCVSITDHLLAGIFLAHPELRCLDFSGCVLVSDFGLVALRCLRTLVELRVARCYLITCSGVLSGIDVHSSSLELLDISECLGLSTDPYRLVRFADSCRNLRYLAMGWRRSAVGLNPVLDHDLVRFASSCHHLTHLNLACGRLSDTGLEAVTRYCASLTHLNISHSGVRDSGLGMIAFHLQDLTLLDLSECCHIISDSGLGNIAASLKKIQSLYLAHCFYVTDKGAERVLSHLPKLRDLSLEGCFHITDLGVQDAHTFEKTTSLCYLNLSGTLITQDAVDAVLQCGNDALIVVTANCPFVEYPRLPGNDISNIIPSLPRIDRNTFMSYRHHT